MFYVFCLFTPLFRRFRLSRAWHAQDLDEIYRLVSKILNFMACGSVFDRFCVEALKFRITLQEMVSATINLKLHYRNCIGGN